ncbi:hypothetical protein KUCAC02_011878 [Chaenocephalus aceratus]|uniref:Uncharacterized protein n=1 Tax=Chaenocephalus aceratus TaxID=36190 RepID=A0ACB9XA79_CHAAC|nr:hypothetical protein KUCAC02_011878 [Chaenocephalus aceratus]
MPVVQFAIIIDGTQDISGVEQESICVRSVDADLQPKEEFLGIYQVWTVRTPAIRSVLKQYESVLMALEEMASCSSPETSAKANATAVATKLDLQPIQIPHVRKPTKRYTGQASAHIHPDAQSLYRVQFYNALDTVNTQFIERFEQAGFHKLQPLENVLLHGDMEKVVEEYPELNSRLLQVQLAMFGANYTYETSSDVASIIREMVPEKKLDRLDLEGICQSFISANDKRKKAFGSFT